MRIDYTGIVDISNTNIGMKESNTVKSQDSSVKIDSLVSETPYGVTATTVEKALFSLESELEKIKQGAQNIDLDLIKSQIAVLSGGLSTEDVSLLGQEGISLNDIEVKTIVTVMDKIKMELAKGGMDVSIFGDRLSMEQLEEITGSAMQAKQMASQLTECSEGDITYLVENELEPTIENIYRAQHSGSKQEKVENQKLPPESQLRDQIAGVISDAGLPVNEITMGYGALLLNNDIPLTVENITYVNQLTQMQLPLAEVEIEEAISQSVMEGRTPGKAYLLEGYSWKDRAVHTQEIVEKATEEDVWTVIQKEVPLTVEALENAGKKHNLEENRQQENSREETEYYQQNIKYVTARRQLEEIRLVMTTQANYHLLKQGISIETMELEQLVDELKGVEAGYYKTLLQQQGIESSAENVEMFQMTMETTEELKYFPSYLLGRHSIEITTMETWHESGKNLKVAMEQANEAYETMMTTPRKDMGDSIGKAFRNVDDILTDLHMDVSQSNRRAVRILGYNQMEINMENITRIKAADEKMQNLFHNMKPAVVMEMIREGIHPLSMDVVSLNKKAEEIAEAMNPGQEEKYSQYLWELEQRHDITAEERDSYIGIYRLLRQIEKTDGAVIGAVVNQGGDLSLRNLLSVVRSKRMQGKEITVDDNFGGITELISEKKDINQQIDAAYQTDCAKEAFHKLTPEGFAKCMENRQWQDMTPEQLLWQLMEQQDTEKLQLQKESYQQQINLFRSNQNAEEAVLQLLQTYELPTDTYHIMAAGQMVNNRNGIFRKLFGPETMEKIPDLQQVKEEILKEFAEAVKTPEDMAKAQLTLAETAENVMENMINEPNATSLDIRELKVLRTQIEISSRMSKEEHYAIPVMVGDEMTNVQLKIVRGTKRKGMVDIIFDTHRMGKVAARMQVSAKRIDGFLLSDSRETLETMKEISQEFADMFRTEEDQQVRFDFAFQDKMSLGEFSNLNTKRPETNENSEEYRVQTKELYHMARTFIEMVQKAG